MSDSDPYADITPTDSAKTLAEAFGDPDFATLVMPTLSEGDRCFDFDLPIYDFSTGSRVRTDESFHLQAVAAKRA